MFCASELAAATGSTYPREILILPEMVRFDDMGRVLSVQHAVDASRPILIREERGTLRTRPLATRLVGIQGASQARLSTSRLAAVLRPGKGARQGDQTYPASEFFVFDSLGSERWRASGVVNFSWSPDGRRLLF